MATITILRLDESTKTRLRTRAAGHGRSMEEEARNILKVALAADRTGPSNLAAAIWRRFAAPGGVDLPDLPRERMRQPPPFRK
jgi:antitoxin FitA